MIGIEEVAGTIHRLYVVHLRGVGPEGMGTTVHQAPAPVLVLVRDMGTALATAPVLDLDKGWAGTAVMATPTTLEEVGATGGI